MTLRCEDHPFATSALAAEYCGRGSLRDVLDAARRYPALARELTWPRKLAIAFDAACGMLYLHARPQGPVVHRDLKVCGRRGWGGRDGGRGSGCCPASQQSSHSLPFAQSPNILLEESWRAKITDFGLCRILDEAGIGTKSSSLAAMNPRWGGVGQPAVCMRSSASAHVF